MGEVINQAISERYAAYHGDTVDVARLLPERSVHFSVFSPPFASLYTYSNSPRDMGNVRDDAEFFAQYDYLIRETARVMVPGRNVAIHCMDMPTSKERDGVIGVRDFPGDIIRAYQRHGFVFHARFAIWKDPVTAMQRTKALGLLHKQIKKDSSMSRQGLLDYVVVMRAPGGPNPEPVTHTNENFPVSLWQRYASPIWNDVEFPREDAEAEAQLLRRSDGSHVMPLDLEYASQAWFDIDPSDTLQYRSAREHDDERHICPLQLEVIRRCIRLWTNPNDVVWSPFMGIGSEGYVALQEGRSFIGAELKRSYYEQSVRNLAEASVNRQPGLFDSVEAAQ